MRKLLVLGAVGAVFLSGCTESGDPNFYKEVMINGEVLTSHVDSLGYPIAEVKYNGKLYKCTGGSSTHCEEI